MYKLKVATVLLFNLTWCCPTVKVYLVLFRAHIVAMVTDDLIMLHIDNELRIWGCDDAICHWRAGFVVALKGSGNFRIVCSAGHSGVTVVRITGVHRYFNWRHWVWEATKELNARASLCNLSINKWWWNQTLINKKTYLGRWRYIHLRRCLCPHSLSLYKLHCPRAAHSLSAESSFVQRTPPYSYKFLGFLAHLQF